MVSFGAWFVTLFGTLGPWARVNFEMFHMVSFQVWAMTLFGTSRIGESGSREFVSRR